MLHAITMLAALLLVPVASFAEGEDEKSSAAYLPDESVDFSMADHVHEYTADEECSLCHNSVTSTFMPQKEVCLSCHDEELMATVTYSGLSSHGPLWGFNHGPAARLDSMDCSACHQQNDCLECHASGLVNDDLATPDAGLTNVHRSEFRVTHPIAARTDQQLCATCHEQSFCTDCHDAFNPAALATLSHRKGFSTGLALNHESFSDESCQGCHTDAVLPSHAWSADHAREARKNLATCQACHPEGDICFTCHSARSGLGANPHPSDWGDIKENLRDASGGKTCAKCH